MSRKESEPRPIEELLKMDTYQDMSDEEITVLINFHVAQAVQTAEFKAQENFNYNQLEILYEREMTKAAQASAMLRELAGLTGYYENVEVK